MCRVVRSAVLSCPVLPCAVLSCPVLCCVQVRGEDFSSYLSKLSTPRELLIMMTEMFARIEAHPEGGLTAQVRHEAVCGRAADVDDATARGFQHSYNHAVRVVATLLSGGELCGFVDRFPAVAC